MIGHGCGCVSQNRVSCAAGRNITEVSVVNTGLFFHAYDPGHSPKAANIHEGHSRIQAENGVTVIRFHLVAVVWLSNSPWKEKGLLEEFFLLIKGFGLEFMQFSWCPDHWPELACGLTKLQDV